MTHMELLPNKLGFMLSLAQLQGTNEPTGHMAGFVLNSPHESSHFILTKT